MIDSFIEEYQKGVEGRNLGLPLGLTNLDYAINGLQRKQIIAIAAAPKVGKSQLVLYSFLIHPYLYAVETGIDIDFIFYSLEMSINEIRYRVAAYFFYHDYGISSFDYNGKRIPISANYLLGKLEDPFAEESLPSGRRKRVNIKVLPEHEKILFEIHKKRIEPMFGKYEGHKKIQKGKVDLIVDSSEANPTGIRNYLLDYARNNGKLLYDNYTIINPDGKKEEKKRLVGYIPNNPEKYVVVYLDHVRKMPIERQFTIKQNIDKLLEYQVQLRNICGFTFVDVIHLNRELTNIERMKYTKEFLFPSPEDIKDTGNISEEANVILTMMNPTDERYRLDKHFGVDISTNPNYRSIHLVESRDTPCPVHMRVNSIEGVGVFTPLLMDTELINC